MRRVENFSTPAQTHGTCASELHTHSYIVRTAAATHNDRASCSALPACARINTARLKRITFYVSTTFAYRSPAQETVYSTSVVESARVFHVLCHCNATRARARARQWTLADFWGYEQIYVKLYKNCTNTRAHTYEYDERCVGGQTPVWSGTRVYTCMDNGQVNALHIFQTFNSPFVHVKTAMVNAYLYAHQSQNAGASRNMRTKHTRICAGKRGRERKRTERDARTRIPFNARVFSHAQNGRKALYAKFVKLNMLIK